jgi:L-lactate utilization protein LutB
MDINKAMENLKSRGFDVSYFEDRTSAVAYLTGQIQGTTVGFGGSMTVSELGLYEALAPGNTVFSHSVQPDKAAAKRGAAEAAVYITSANGIAESGEIVNIDGAGNRVAATLYNKKRVYYIVGINKFTDTLEQAVWRAKNIAAPKNAQRLNRKTPCARNADRCYNCNSPECICRALVIMWKKMMGLDKAEVIIINEDLGY